MDSIPVRIFDVRQSSVPPVASSTSYNLFLFGSSCRCISTRLTAPHRPRISIRPLRTPSPSVISVSSSREGPVQYIDNFRDFHGPFLPNHIYSSSPTVSTALELISVLVRDPNLRVLFGSMLGGTEDHRNFPSASAAIYRDRDGMILCAFNDELVDDLGFDPHHMTMHVPTAALVETNMEPPAIFSLLYENRDRTPRRLDDEQDARDYYDNCLAQLTVGIIYLAKIIPVVMIRGPLAVCNPGAGLAIPKHEFHNLGGRADGRTDIFRTYLDGFVYNRELSALSDSSCGRIFSPQGFAEIITVEHNGTVELSLFATGEKQISKYEAKREL
ncbi:hypothetical protein R3P38DRAFT_3480721 [Favolaschia claudopus]|uniref:Uncharacterized protein n=1 Tax=Favolaschia claudopus TaxID=2862362 RepID=A0AAW0CFU0_9AGAR